jgi:alpha-L-arabinofuranosidase
MKKIIAFMVTLMLLATMCTFPATADEKAVLNISANDTSYDISDNLYGLFIEDISYACDGGLVSNLVNNDSFEYQFNQTTGWTFDNLDVTTDENSNPLNKNNPTYATITVDGKGSVTNIGFTEMYDYKTYDRNEEKANTADMGFKENGLYDFSCYINNTDFEGTVSVYLNSPSNKNNVTELDISKCGNVWSKLETTLTSNAQEDGGLTIEFNGTGTLCLDFVELVPQDSYGYSSDQWKYTTLRSDLYTALEQMSPSFIRFPGGCLAEGDSLENLYSWKDTIGPLEERVQFYNLWRDDSGRDYINTMAMGYHEYFQLCSDLGAEALPILNVGLTCQARSGYEAHEIALEKLSMTDDEWETYLTEKQNLDPEDTEARDDYTNWIESLGINSRQDFEDYLDEVALRPGTAEWDAYVQDILDLIEYANGDATTTYWGALRAANGSTEPFNLKYIGLGNENWGEVYERNFKALYEEVKAVYPDITVISSAGTYLEGEDYDENWSWINEGYTDTIVDEHYYTYDGYLFDHNDRYDDFDRDGAHVFIGEYASTPSGVGTLTTKSNIYGAVEEASYLTGIERNGDLVEMASYAPTFAKVNAQSWNVNLIWFDSQEVVLTPNYYVQMLYSNNYGSKYIKSTFTNGETIQDGIYESVTVDEDSQTLYVKLVNTTGKSQSVDVNLSDFGSINRVSTQSIKGNYKSACNEIGKNTTYPVETDLTTGESVSVDLGKYDVTILRVAYGSNDGSSLYTLPDFISTMTTDTTTYYPPAVKIGVPCGIVGGIVIIGAVTAIVIVIKKKKSEKNG